jgi:micrococcal nuclease
MNKIVIFFLCIFLAIASNAFAFKATLQSKVMQVKDGDTIVVSPVEGGEFFICRLYGIDAPEIPHGNKPGQPFGEESTKELKKIILGQDVIAEIRDKDKYGREVCVIRKDGTDINREMIKKGMAWAYRKYLKPPYASEYIDAESDARGKGLGLWKESQPQPPWEHRKAQREP